MASSSGKHAIVTGGAGFIGGHLVKALIDKGYEVTVMDDFSSGSESNLPGAINELTVVRADLRDEKTAMKHIRNADIVFHLAANFSVKRSTEEPLFDAHSNLVSTLNVLEAMRKNDIPSIVFTSSSTVYGETVTFPIAEDSKTDPISNYGASKLGSEIYISSFSRLYGMSGLVLRYANIIGPRCSHGVIVDFVNKLRANPRKLEILGDGGQKKSYLDVEDCVAATLFATERMPNLKIFDVFNIGSTEWITVDDIAGLVCSEMGLKGVEYAHTGGRVGWGGDVRKFLLSTQKLNELGWTPKYDIERSIRRTVRWLEGEKTI
jgi:UDP-glucose 4-epimerase